MPLQIVLFINDGECIYCVALQDVDMKHTAVFVSLVFVAAQILRTLINYCGNLIHLDLLVQGVCNETP